MSRRGKRYDVEPHLNIKKVLAVIVAIVVIAMVIFMLKSMLTKSKETGRIISMGYFALYADNKWGIIDSSGNEIIAPSYQEMIKVPNNKKDVFLCTYDINSETGEYKTKALNSKNEEIFTEYIQIEPLENFDKNNNLWYEDNVLKVEQDEKYGLIDLSGKQILPCEYDYITVVTGVKNSIKVQKDGNYGLVSTEGTMIIKPTCSEITNLGDDYKNGYITVDEDKNYGVVDYTGTKILENKFEKIEQIYGKDVFVAVQNGKQELVNTNGEVVLAEGFDEIKQILGYTTKGIVFEKSGKCGVMNLEGETLIDNIYDDLKEVKDSIFVAKRGENFGIIDIENNIKIDFVYSAISYNSIADIFMAEDTEHKTSVMDNNFQTRLTGVVSEINDEKGYFKIKIGNEYKYYNFKFEEKDVKDVLTTNTLFLSKKDSKYGFVNAKGEVIIDYQYDDATEQNSYGYAAIKKNGKWGAIDINGKVVLEPTYNLENNFVIDFIGKWHLGQDINMNYYCEK